MTEHTPELDVERTAENLTRWMMGDGFVKVTRWMTVGWRESMFDEGVALWTAALREYAALSAQPQVSVTPGLREARQRLLIAAVVALLVSRRRDEEYEPFAEPWGDL